MAKINGIFAKRIKEEIETVFKDSKDFKEFLDICNRSADIYGNSFTYILIKEEDLG